MILEAILQNSLLNQLNLIHFDVDTESAIEFNARFSTLVERIRKVTPDFSEDEERRAYLLAIHGIATETVADDRHEKRTSGKGFPVQVLMEKFVTEENERHESERRKSERAAVAAVNVSKSAPKPNSSRRNSPERKEQRGRGPAPSCKLCGHAPDNHGPDDCPHKGKIYCYRCHTYGYHIGRDCPAFGDNVNPAARRNDDRNDSRRNNDRQDTRPVKPKSLSKFKKASF